MSELEIKDYINGYMNGIGWNKDEINIVEYRNRIFDMYLKQYNHYKELHISLNNFDNISKSKYNFLNTLNVIKSIEGLNSLKELKTDEQILNYSIDEVNNIIRGVIQKLSRNT